MRRRWPGPGGGDAAPAAEPELVRRAAGGDRLAFERLYEAYVDRVHRYVIARVRDEATARDLVQDVFLSAMGGLHGLRQDERFAHWLFRLAHNRVANHWRDTARRPELVMLPGLGGAGEGPANSPPRELALLSGDDPRTLAEQGLEADRLLALVDRLTDGQRQVLLLRFVADLPVADVAAVLECSEDAVKKLQRRALASLRRWLDGYPGGGP